MFYLIEEGKFFYYYLLSIAILAAVVTFFACCFGGILFTSGSFVSLKFIEETLANMEKIPGMMKPKDKED